MPGNRTFRWTLSAVVLGGLLIRVVWVLVFHPVPMSDYLRYVVLARTLVSRHIYAEDNFRACVPPGAAFFLAGAMAIVGDHWWTPALVSLVCYLVSVLLIARLAYIVAGKSSCAVCRDCVLHLAFDDRLYRSCGVRAHVYSTVRPCLLSRIRLGIHRASIKPDLRDCRGTGCAYAIRCVALAPGVADCNVGTERYKFTFWRDRKRALALTSCLYGAYRRPLDGTQLSRSPCADSGLNQRRKHLLSCQ